MVDGFHPGFFLNLFQNTRNTLKSEEIQAFTSLNSNQERFKFAHNVSGLEEKLKLKRHARENNYHVSESEIFFHKDQNCAIEMKKVGNKFFQNNQWNEALNFYNKSYLMLPSDCRKFPLHFPF